MSGFLLLMLLAVFEQSQASLVIEDCPLGWEPFELNCYQFNLYPLENHKDAYASCLANGATLVSVESLAEHKFISNWLEKHRLYGYMFYTSGQRNPSSPSKFTWTAKNSYVLHTASYWLNPGEDSKTGTVITYSMSGSRVGWTVSTEDKKIAYICEISKSESYRILQEDRDLAFGEVVPNMNDIKRGPEMITEPKDTIAVRGETSSTYLECQAAGNPSITYTWYRENKRVTSLTNSRYTITNGKITFSNPQESEDAGSYQCHATNQFGTILSSPVQLSFASIGEFSTTETEAVVTKAYDSAIVVCSPIPYKPALRYQWIKGSGSNFIRPKLQPYIFISNNGKLYFSEITRDDAGEYRCIVTLTGDGDTPLKTSQPPSRTSRPITVAVQFQAPKASWGPVIQNDFISVFPSPPMKGNTIQLECFALGTYTEENPLIYSWSKDNGGLSNRVLFQNHNRILIIENAQFNDEGTYRCVVKRGSQDEDQKDYTLSLSSKPYFIYPLKAQFPDVGSRLTWLCIAAGKPNPTYEWYKNGELLKPIPGQIKINGNVLIINSVQENRDRGMYQCSAKNSYGVTFSTAQLKILNIPPRWIRYQLQPVTPAAIGGNISLICNPDAAPKAQISWSKDGMSVGSTSGRVTVLTNGNLVITGVMKSDEGNYKCTAKNNLGEAEQSTTLRVEDHMVIVHSPENKKIRVNETTFLYCTVSYNPYYETVHMWYLNGRALDIDQDPTYILEKSSSKQGLYIRRADQRKAGRYTCTVENPLERVSASATLTIISPPGEVSGVYGEDSTLTQNSIRIRWLAAPDNGSPIGKYDIQAYSDLDPGWKTVLSDFPDAMSNVDNELFKAATIDGLLPYNTYKFRLIAYNVVGFGPASLPSAGYRTLSSAPTKAPSGVGGGGGSVGLLSIFWEPLSPSEQGAKGIGYNVYWREKSSSNAKWAKGYDPILKHPAMLKELSQQIGKFFVNVLNKYYVEYEVKVQAFNDVGKGPNSTISNVYSAEGMPIGVPTDVVADTYNATAMVVTWTPVINNHYFMKGKILGYQVNWYDRDMDDPPKYSQSFYGSDLDEVIVIGLIPNAYYWVTVQVFNSAGLGPVSENYLGSTGMNAPVTYPTEINVYTRSESSVLVTFRGVSFGLDEGRVEGYKACYWPVTEAWNPDNHCLEFGLVSELVIENLEKDALYKLRIMAFSGDGDGKKSELVYFTLGGRVAYDPTTYDVLALANRNVPFLLMLFFSWAFTLLLQSF